MNVGYGALVLHNFIHNFQNWLPLDYSRLAFLYYCYSIVLVKVNQIR